MKIWTAWTISIKGNSILFYVSAEAAMAFPSSIKSKRFDRYLTKLWQRLLSTKSLDWTEVSFSLACKRYFIYAGWINKMPANYQNPHVSGSRKFAKFLRTLPDVSLSPISWIETRWRQLRSLLNLLLIIVRRKRLLCKVIRFFKALLLAISSTISWRFDQKRTVDYQTSEEVCL